MGKPSRDKGARGERRCVDYFKGLGIPAHRVSSLETDANSPVAWDVEAGGKKPWTIQVKEVARNCPPLPKLMKGAHLGFVHFTNGDTFVVVRAEELEELAKMVTEGGR